MIILRFKLFLQADIFGVIINWSYHKLYDLLSIVFEHQGLYFIHLHVLFF